MQWVSILLAPYDRRFLDVFRPDTSRPVAHSEKVFGEEWIPLQGVDWSVVAVIGANDLLSWSLCLPVAGHDQALLRPHHELSWLHEHQMQTHDCSRSRHNATVRTCLLGRINILLVKC